MHPRHARGRWPRTPAAIVVALALACAPAGARRGGATREGPPAAATAPDSCAPTRGQKVMELVNARRAQAGLEPLEVDEQLVAAAEEHAHDLVGRSGVPGHEGSDGSHAPERVTRAGYVWTRVAENVAAGVTEPSMVVALWMNSQGHRQNILTPEFRDAGVGSAGSPRRTIWVMVYGHAPADQPRKTLSCHP